MNSILAYSMSFVSFLFQKLSEKETQNIKEIILYGSASRGTMEKGSDIDIFINVFRENGIKKNISKAVGDFYKGELFNKYWKLQSIDNEISCIVGKLDKWKDLKASIVANGISLYSKYTGHIKGKGYVLFYWESIRPESKRTFLSKKLYGYSYKGKIYKGLIEESGGEKLGTNCISIPLENAKAMAVAFRELGISVRTIHITKH